MTTRDKITNAMPYLSALATCVSILVMLYTLRQFHLQNKERQEKELLERAKALMDR